MIELLKAAGILLGVFVYFIVGLALEAVLSEDPDEPQLIFVILWLPMMTIAIISAIAENLFILAWEALCGVYASIRKFLRRN